MTTTSWTSGDSSTLTGATGISNVSCVPTRMCIATTSHGEALKYDRGTWAKSVVLWRRPQSSYISCSSRQFCMALGSKGSTRRWNGRHWARAQPVFTMQYDSSAGLDCPSSTFCVAGDEYGLVATYNGRRWSRLTAIMPGQEPVQLACTSAHYCIALGFYGHTATYNGHHWTGRPRAPKTAQGNDYNAVSCASVTSCFAENGSGYVSRFTGHRWTTPHRQYRDGSAGLAYLSCTGPSFCLFTEGAYYDRYNGRRWTPTVQLQSPTTFSGLGCADPTLCIAGRLFAAPARYNGATWHTTK